MLKTAFTLAFLLLSLSSVHANEDMETDPRGGGTGGGGGTILVCATSLEAGRLCYQIFTQEIDEDSRYEAAKRFIESLPNGKDLAMHMEVYDQNKY